MKKILVTGAAGFIGSHVVEHLLKNTDWHIIIFDRLSYAANGFHRIRDIHIDGVSALPSQRIDFFVIDTSRPISHGVLQEVGDVNYILHMAAETHVDNSIADPLPFVYSNVLGTFHMLEFARSMYNLEKFVYFSTDEIFGPASQRVGKDTFDEYSLSLRSAYKEWDRYNSTNPYSATKAAGEELCLAWSNTYRIPMVITHTMNNFGERQHPEKFIPSTVKKLIQGEPITVHADASRTKAGSRFYIHCRNTADAVLFLLQNSLTTSRPLRDKFNIVGEREISNLELVGMIYKYLQEEMAHTIREPRIVMTDFHSSRPGHDLRYALDGSKMKELGWTPPNTIEDSLRKTIAWMVNPANIRWLMMQNKGKEQANAGNNG